MKLESETQYALIKRSGGSPKSLLQTFRETLWLIILGSLLVSCTTPVPSDLESAYVEKVKEDRDSFYEVWQTPQAEITPDSDIAGLRSAHAAGAISDIAQHVSQYYRDDLDGALKYIKKQRFDCSEGDIIRCENYTRIYPLTVDPLAFLRSVPTHCISWVIEIAAKNMKIQTLTPSSKVSACKK